MRKIILLLILLFGILEVNAYDISSEFYYDEEKVTGMWITREKDSVIMSGLPFFLKRKGDDAIVYCLEPFSLIKQEEGYKGYYNKNSYFNITDEQLEKIRLIAYFGYMYPGHESDTWYGVTQYLIWKVAEPNADIYFTKERYGAKENLYLNEINEIESLINSYYELLKFNGKTYKFYNIEEFNDFKALNIFFNKLNIENKNVTIPFNSNVQEKEVLFFHEDGQNLYMPSALVESEITIDIEFNKNVLLKKYYGSGKYKPEKGAVFELYKDGEFLKEVITNDDGEYWIDLAYGNYKLVQKVGKKGYSFINDYEFTVDSDSTNVIELYNEAIIVDVPDTRILGTIYDFFRINLRKFRAVKIY